MSDQVRRIKVWPGALRVTHWVMAFAVLVLLGSGWLLHSGMVLSEQLHALLLEQLHLPAGHLLGLALVARFFFLATDKGVGGLPALLPNRASWPGIIAGLRFYTSFGRAPVPRYYAHHPLWAPLYLVWFGLLLMQLLTGLALEFGVVRGWFGLATEPLLRWHLYPLTLLGMLVVLHLVSAVLNDLKGEGSDISAMVNGHRTFSVTDPQQSSSTTAPRVHAVSLDDIGRRVPGGKTRRGD